MRPHHLLLSLIFIFASVSPMAATGVDDTTFKVRLIADPQTFDWNIAHTSMETIIVKNIMEGLYEFDREMKVQPALAKSCSLSKDGRVYTCKLRDGVLWSDGRPLEAGDFVFSWKRLLDPLTAAPYSYILFGIEGAEEFYTRKDTNFENVGIKAIDASTLQITLKKPMPYFLQLLTFWVTYPMRKDVVEKHGNDWSKPGNTVVLGAYIPVSYQPQNQVLLTRNRKYYGKAPQVENVQLKIINEDATALNLFKTGQLDFVRPVNQLELSDPASRDFYKTAPYYRTCYIHINANKYPFNLVSARKALAQAIDKAQLVKAMHRPVTHTNTLLPDTLLRDASAIGYKFNAEAAKKSFKETGLTPEQISSGLDFYAYASDENALLSQFIQDQLKKNLGLKLNLQLPDFKMFRTQLELQTAPLFYRCWGADYADPDTYFSLFLSTSGNNRTGWKNSRYDELVKKAAETLDEKARRSYYKEALEILLVKDVVIVPLHFDSFNYILSRRIKNFYINPLNYLFFKNIEIAK